MLYQLHLSNYEYNYNLNENGQITILFFTYPQSLLLLHQYPEVLLIDCIYKTNQFHLPLLDIIGSTGLNMTFYTGYVFFAGESKQDYYWALNELKVIMQKKTINLPKVIVMDRNLALMNAIEVTFLAATNLLCG